MLVGFADDRHAPCSSRCPSGCSPDTAADGSTTRTQRVMDAFQSFPALVFALALAFVLGASTVT